MEAPRQNRKKRLPVNRKLKEKQNRKKEKKSNRGQENALSAQALAEQQARKEAERLAAIVPGSNVKIKGNFGRRSAEINGKNAVPSLHSAASKPPSSWTDWNGQTRSPSKRMFLPKVLTSVRKPRQHVRKEVELQTRHRCTRHAWSEALQAVTYFIDDAILVGMSRDADSSWNRYGHSAYSYPSVSANRTGVSYFADANTSSSAGRELRWQT